MEARKKAGQLVYWIKLQRESRTTKNMSYRRAREAHGRWVELACGRVAKHGLRGGTFVERGWTAKKVLLLLLLVLLLECRRRRRRSKQSSASCSNRLDTVHHALLLSLLACTSAELPASLHRADYC